MTRIALTNGPWNGRHLVDSGTVTIRMGIATEWEATPYGRRPVRGCRIGCAVYEPSEDRTRAFWLGNEWEGICHGTYEA